MDSAAFGQSPKIIYQCEKCNEQVKYGENYCSHCGAELDWGDDKTSAQYCSDCGEEIDVGDDYCWNCGKYLLHSHKKAKGRSNRSNPRDTELQVSSGAAHISVASRIIGFVEIVLYIIICAVLPTLAKHGVLEIFYFLTLPLLARGVQRLFCYTKLSWDKNSIHYRQNWFDVVSRKVSFSDVESVKLTSFSETFNYGTIELSLGAKGWRSLKFIDNPKMIIESLEKNIKKNT